MILRRVITHFRKQEWTAIALDFLIVVLGVFVGLQVSNWSEARADRRDEQATIKSLHDEIVAAEAFTTRTLRVPTTDALLISTATDIVAGNIDDRALTGEERRALAGSGGLYIGRFDLPSLARLQSTGRLDIVRSVELNNALVTLIQKREGLELAMQTDRFSHDLMHLYPAVFSARSALVPSDY